MKKLLILLSLLVITLFVVSCAPKEGGEGEEGALAGQAVKLSKADLTSPVCKVIDVLQVNGEKFNGTIAAEACKSIGRTCISLVTSRSQYIEAGQKNIFYTDISGDYYCDSTILGETKTDKVASPIGLDIRTINQVFCCR